MSKTGKGRAEISREYIQELLKEEDVSGHIPDDAILVGLEYNPDRDTFDAVLISDEWPETFEAERIANTADIDV